MSESPQWTAVQGAAVLILLRLFQFFCCAAPYSAAHAKGMALTAGAECILLLPLLHFKSRLQISGAALWILRIYAIFYAAVLTGSLHALSTQLQFQLTIIHCGLSPATPPACLSARLATWASEPPCRNRCCMSLEGDILICNTRLTN